MRKHFFAALSLLLAALVPSVANARDVKVARVKIATVSAPDLSPFSAKTFLKRLRNLPVVRRRPVETRRIIVFVIGTKDEGLVFGGRLRKRVTTCGDSYTDSATKFCDPDPLLLRQLIQEHHSGYSGGD